MYRRLYQLYPIKSHQFMIFHMYLLHIYTVITLWLFNIAMDNCPFIDGLPIKNGWIFHGYVSHNQRVYYTGHSEKPVKIWFLMFSIISCNLGKL